MRLVALVGWAGCVRVLELPEHSPGTSLVDLDGTGDADTDTDADVDTDSDTDGDTDTDSGGDTDTGIEHELICVPGSALGYRLPSVRWGLSAAYASRRLDDRPGSALQLSPSWFLAMGWQSTAFGCADYGAPWVADPEYQGDEGCLALEEGTVWTELCRLYPGDYPCDLYAGTFTGDTPEASALGLAWFALAAHALLGRFGVDPDDWYASSGDPLAVERLSAAMQLWGPWTGEIEAAVTGCPDDIEACLENDLLRHVQGVADKFELLSAAPCADDPLDPEDVRAFVAGLAAARPGWDWAAAEDAALAALTGDGFSTEAGAVFDAIDAAAPLQLACPELELYEWYHLPCP